MASVLLFTPPPQSSKLTEFLRLRQADAVSVELQGEPSSSRTGAGRWSNDGAVRSGRVTADGCLPFFGRGGMGLGAVPSSAASASSDAETGASGSSASDGVKSSSPKRLSVELVRLRLSARSDDVDRLILLVAPILLRLLSKLSSPATCNHNKHYLERKKKLGSNQRHFARHGYSITSRHQKLYPAARMRIIQSIQLPHFPKEAMHQIFFVFVVGGTVMSKVTGNETKDNYE